MRHPLHPNVSRQLLVRANSVPCTVGHHREHRSKDTTGLAHRACEGMVADSGRALKGRRCP
jgi:hypothetical protein